MLEIFCWIGLTLFLNAPEVSSTATGGEWKLVWSDEFDGTGAPDAAKWGYDVGDACDLPMGCGWGNNELQYYTRDRRENARVENGVLTIEAHRETYETREYTSARLVSKAHWKYGRFECRARLPEGRGTWAAFWMLPSGGEYGHGHYGPWPHSGEIDILEYVGYQKDTIYSNTHTLKYNGLDVTDQPGSVYIAGVENSFKTYALEWSEDRMDFFVDDRLFHTYHGHDEYEVWPFDRPFYLILNLAVGGNWGGRKGVDETIWPQQYEIDYVRVYQKETNQ